ncbi:YfkD famly protein [Virgibacillus chiguensis]|uniref:YfkD-like protein n=1 Tax=Virgibacillus chiguensis TaxID=411959 RepID=A0A1M5W0H6_9BACI|nr:YfkD famly protein [Virgibacillus chiguensis]SHH81005.1 YfkD-like protein [Virgibacillus chiguensis]
MNRRKHSIFLILFVSFIVMALEPSQILAKEKKESFKIPSHVLNISKDNTFPNSTEDEEVIEPSELTKELTDSLDIQIENPVLIKMLNETTLNPSPIAFGYRGMVYLGRWPLNYESLETTINWEYQQVNKNELNNTSGSEPQEINYIQQEQKEIKGALTNKISKPSDVKKMMLLTAKEKTELPLSYQTVIGKNTKKDNTYKVPSDKLAVLQSYAPAVNEKGQVTFGEVYVKLKGSDKSIAVKNVTKQGIGAWIPIQDHVSFSYKLK